MITSAGPVEDGCLSFFRAYHVGVHSLSKPASLLQRAAGAGIPWRTLDIGQHSFYELSTLHQGQVARAVWDGHVVVDGWLDVGGEQVRIHAPVDLHLLVHQSGMVVLRPSIRLSRLVVRPDTAGEDLRTVLSLERALCDPDARLTWTSRAEEVAVGWVRNLLNYHFLQLVDVWGGKRRQAVEVLREAAVETALGAPGLHRLHRRGLLDHPYPVTFGSEIQLVMPFQPGEREPDWNDRAEMLACEALPPLGTGIVVPPRDVEKDVPGVGWFFDENRALTVRATCQVNEELGVFDVDRTQTVEYLTIRRAALSNVRRASQISLIERQPVSRAQVDRWQHLVASTTDDYVLDARIGCLFETARAAFESDPRLRSVNALEQQVGKNIEALDLRMESVAQRSGGLVGALFGGGALVLGLQGAVQFALAMILGVEFGEIPTRYAGWLAVSQVMLVTVSFFVIYLILRQTSRVLRPVSSGWR